jgi:precorrin-6B methylase 2
MILLALFAVVFSFFEIATAHGQAGRGFAGGSRGFGVAVQPGRTTIQTTPGRANIQTTPRFAVGTPPLRASIGPFAPSTGAFVPRANVQIHRGAPVFVPPLAPHNHFRSPSLGLNNRNLVNVPVAPVPLHHHFRGPPVFHHPGIVILDVPAFSDTTVITQTVPGVVVPDRRPADVPPSDLRTRTRGQLAPFDPTPQDVVERMLNLAGVKSGDLIYDLGSGDGRVAVAAAKKYGVRAVGFEIDAGLVKLARENIRKEGVEHLVEIRQQDFLTADLSPASVVTLYLSYDGNLSVRPQLMSQLKPGARVVSYTFDMGDWQSKIAQSYRDTTGNLHMMYLWEIGGAMVFSDSRR